MISILTFSIWFSQGRSTIEVLRDGARTLLAQAVEEEVAGFLAE